MLLLLLLLRVVVGGCAMSNNSDKTIISDGLVNGVPADADCPVCGTAGLVQCAGRITCWGHQEDGVTACPYKCKLADVQRFKWSLTPAAQRHLVGDPMEEDQEIDFSAYKVPQLKEELKARGLRTSVMVVPFVSQPECHIISLSSLIRFGAGKQEGPFRSPS